MTNLQDYGYVGLFAGSFLAATILPFSSEALLSMMIVMGYDMPVSIAVATAGNWLGGMSSYYLGYLGKLEWIEKYLKVKKSRLIKVKSKMRDRGGVVAFFCWLPVIGDLIAIALGLLRSNVWVVSLFMLLGKLFRYAVLGYFTYHML
ncbi:MAG: DedA family protein [bacterium]|nr:DedA family protein [bacterium]